MKDVTSALHSYREAVRHLWNTQVLAVADASPDKWCVRDRFDDACSILFGILVVEKLGLAPATRAGGMLEPSRTTNAPSLPWLLVVPTAPSGVPIMINRDATSDHGYWDHPLERVSPGEVDLQLVGWFDFDELAYRDFTYYRVRIAGSVHRDIIGRAALIPCEYARVLLDEAAFAPARPDS